MARDKDASVGIKMKIELELDDRLYQVIKKMAPEVDIEIALSELIKGVIIMLATHDEEFIRAHAGGSKETQEIVDEQMRKILPKIIEKATLGVYECDDCHQQFTIPQEDFNEVTCPSCGKKWAIEDLPKIERSGQRRFAGD